MISSRIACSGVYSELVLMTNKEDHSTSFHQYRIAVVLVHFRRSVNTQSDGYANTYPDTTSNRQIESTRVNITTFEHVRFRIGKYFQS